ncbi:MAG: 16S rRNA (guanine(527)-N(7))-methyltransferase RsmG, partial [Planctomycetia bacterium]|nr:16S rRNA (guanine(527)-N(7))-methyltransferase RsmG [Planctomycetia bacterium]
MCDENITENVTEEVTENASDSRKLPITDEPSLEKLRETLTKYGIEVSEPQMELLEKFCELQWDWNQKINLTRHTTYEKFVTRDLLDTLAFSEFLAPNEKVLDVGSGSGVPGILLGILRPDISISLVECVGKKAKVLADIIHELQLPIPVYCALGQDILGNWQFHTLTFRAVASMKKILEWFKPCWPHFDRMLLVKGPKWINERGEARHYSLLKGLALRKLKEYSQPTLLGEVATQEPEGSGESVILQICPEEKLGKGNLCQLSSLETSKSRNKYDHNKRRKSRVTEETIEYIDAADFDGLDEDGDVVELEKNTPRSRFRQGKHQDEQESGKTGRYGKSSGGFGRGFSGNSGSREGRGERRGYGNRDERDGREGRGYGSREGRENRGYSSGFGGRGGGLDTGYGERKRFGGPKKSQR